jgi:hypothetical protein
MQAYLVENCDMLCVCANEGFRNLHASIAQMNAQLVPIRPKLHNGFRPSFMLGEYNVGSCGFDTRCSNGS